MIHGIVSFTAKKQPNVEAVGHPWLIFLSWKYGILGY